MKRFLSFFLLTHITFLIPGIKSTDEPVLNFVTHEKNIQDIILGYLDQYVFIGKDSLTKSRPVKKIISTGTDLLVIVHDLSQPELYHYKVTDRIKYRNQFDYHAADTVIDEMTNNLVSVYNNPAKARYDHMLDGHEKGSMALCTNNNFGIQQLAQNKYIVVGSPNQIAIFDTKTDALCKQLKKARLSTFMCAPNGTQIAYGRLDNGVGIWDIVAEHEQICEREDQKYSAISLAFSPNGKLLIAVCRSFFVIWDAKNGKKIYESKKNSDWQHIQVLFTPHGNSFAIASQLNGSAQSKIDFFDTSNVRSMLTIPPVIHDLKAMQTIESSVPINTMLFLKNGILCVGCPGYLGIYTSQVSDLQQVGAVVPDQKESKTESGCIIC